MSLAEAVTQVANECGYVVNSAVIGTTDTTTKQLLAMSQRIIKEMGTEYPWTKLYKQATITMVSGESLYTLPADFSFYHYETFWDNNKHWRLYGPLTPEEYGDIQGYGLTAAPYSQFQIRGISSNQLYIYPTPSASGATIIFQYISERYVRPRQWTASLAVTIGSYIFNDGNYYTAGSTGTTGTTAPTGTTTSNDGSITWTYYAGTYPTFLVDTDEPLFSQRVFQQGLLERFAEIKQLAVVSRFSDQLNEVFSREIPGKLIWAGADYPGYVLQARQGTVLFGNPLR